MITRRQFGKWVMKGSLLVPAAGLLTSNVRAASYLPNRRKAFRNSTPVPLTLSVTALQYLRADSIIGADGDLIGTWTDDTGNATATQATGSLKPVLKLAVYNGHACARFDGTNDIMDHASVTSSACWMVIKGTTWNSSVSYVSGGAGKGWFPDAAAVPAGPGGYDGTNGRYGNNASRIGTSGIHSVLCLSTKVYVDGVEVAGYALAQTLGTIAVSRLNSRTDVNAYFSAMDLIEIAHYNGTPSAGDITALKTWAQTTYGTP